MALLIPTDGDAIEVQPENGTDYKLAQLYRLLGCEMVEVVRLTDDDILVIDEEGKCKHEDYIVVNPKATALARTLGAIPEWDYIAGPALLCGDKEVR